jgi:lysophospholipase L1-like esterase
MKRRTALWLVLAPIGFLALVQAQQADSNRWVATWTTAQLLTRAALPVTPAGPAGGPTQSIGTRGFSNQTVRMIARVSIGGKRLRIKLANAFGSAPVALGAAHVALRSKGSEIVPGSDRTVTFGGKLGCNVGPGMVILSDPVDLAFPALADLAVSLHFPGETGPPTTHATGLHTTYISKEGDVTGAALIVDPITTQSYYYLAGIDVLAPAGASLIVALGDSITDGSRSTPDTDHSWPALFAARLAARKDTANLAVANMGIGGNRLLRDGTGASALARFDRDVLSQSGVKWLVLLEGINDTGRGATVPAEAATAEELIFAHKQIIERAHAHGIKVVGATLTPYEGATYFREEGEAVRQALNAWIRSRGAYDAVADFDAATRDKANPRRIRAEFDPGDHLHPNDAGYQAMADAIDVAIFTGQRAMAAPPKK